MELREIAENYIKYLQDDNLPKLITLFSKDAKVHSPLFGTKPASEFYSELSKETTNSTLSIHGIFEDKTNDKIALYFNYQWTLANGVQIDFNVVDIISFKNKKIIDLKILYDSSKTRKYFE